MLIHLGWCVFGIVVCTAVVWALAYVRVKAAYREGFEDAASLAAGKPNDRIREAIKDLRIEAPPDPPMPPGFWDSSCVTCGHAKAFHDEDSYGGCRDCPVRRRCLGYVQRAKPTVGVPTT